MLLTIIINHVSNNMREVSLTSYPTYKNLGHF